ncbi:MAG TPA: hypothetical protein VK217_06790, partial [Acidimicrobiales bacterium]|nr:hypothetical protein [Acidimicrobiales bacterium]
FCAAHRISNSCYVPDRTDPDVDHTDRGTGDAGSSPFSIWECVNVKPGHTRDHEPKLDRSCIYVNRRRGFNDDRWQTRFRNDSITAGRNSSDFAPEVRRRYGQSRHCRDTERRGPQYHCSNQRHAAGAEFKERRVPEHRTRKRIGGQ